LRLLCEHGWYLGLDLNGPIYQLQISIKYADLISKGRIAEVNSKLSHFFKGQEREIERNLTAAFPKRVKQIKAAMRAHRRGEYYLSIPVFFAFVEGISQELTKYRFFKTESMRKWARSIEDAVLIKQILEPLKVVGASQQRQSSQASGLKRHDVLHGASTNYGDDPVNSYKALSLLNYVGNTLRQNCFEKVRKPRTGV
jgi:plasmid maintenance system killer protein